MILKKSYLPVLLFLCLLFAFSSLEAQIVVDEAPRGLYYARTKRITNFWEMKDFRDVFHSDKYLLGRHRFSGNIGYVFQRVIMDDGLERNAEYRSAMSFFTRIRFFEEFSFNTNFYLDFNKRAAARWISDYTYSVGRYNWRPWKFNYGYENYINNKYDDRFDMFLQKMTEGYFFVSYNVVPGDETMKLFQLDSTSGIKIVPFARWAFRYRDEKEVVHYEGKPQIGFTARYTMFWNIYVEGGMYYYFDPVFRQLPWDPDYSYGFGYFDWRSFRFSLTYGNWAINRFPWKKKVYPDYGFLDGVFKFNVNWIW